MVFSDGVDNLVRGDAVFHSGAPCKVDPCEMVSALLQDNIENSVAFKELGHPVQSKWNGENENRAVEVLGNLLGGTDISRLEACLDQEKLAQLEGPTPFHIDDVTIILCSISEVAPTYT